MSESLRVHARVRASRANGPGVRWVLWLQGCTLACPGCFNPGTHDERAGYTLTVDDILQEVRSLEDTVEGITITGGEPLGQPAALFHLLSRIREETSLGILIFTGYAWGEIVDSDRLFPVVALADVLIAGRYVADEHLGRGLRGSSNQEIHLLTSRYSASQLAAVPEIEITIQGDGEVTMTGVAPLPRSKVPRRGSGL